MQDELGVVKPHYRSVQAQRLALLEKINPVQTAAHTWEL